MIPNKYPGTGLLLFLIVIFLVFMFSSKREEDNRAKTIKDETSLLGDSLYKFIKSFKIEDYKKLDGLKTAVGRFIIFYVDNNYIDKNLLHDIDSSFLTHNINQLESVIALEERRNIVGKYSNGAPAEKITLIIHYLDVKSKTEFAIDQIKGGDPVSSFKSRNSQEGACGPPPTNSEIIQKIIARIKPLVSI